MTVRVLACSAAAIFLAASLAGAQDAETPAASEAPAAPATPKSPEELSQFQLQLMRDFERFEKSLYDVAEYSRRNDPERAELLYRARSQSQEQRILSEMQALADSLKPQAGGKLVIGDAPERQDQVLARLQDLLKVLQSADQRDQNLRDQERIKDLLKDTVRLIGKQRDVRADTNRSDDASQLSDEQKNVSEDAQKLAEKIDRQDKDRNPNQSSDDPKANPKGKEGDDNQNPDDPKSPSENDPKKPDDGKSDPTKPEGENKKPGAEQSPDKPGEKPPMPGQPQGEQTPGAPSDPQKSKPQDSNPQQPGQKTPPESQQPQEGEPSDSPPQQPSELGKPSEPQSQPAPQPQGDQPKKPERTPGREQLEEARNQMKRAIEELLKKQKDPSLDAQQKALAKLEQMKARLEEILRQLREQEKELMLASLESRLQKIRKAQMQINAETVRLDKIPAAERDDRHLNRSVALSRDERDVVLDTEKALELLKTEGSSVAFPEALEQMRDNMLTVSGRLNRGDTAETTQVIEELIVETLDEMILAISKEMQRQKERQQQPQQQQQQGGEQEQRLVQEIAELKMIRSLQNQINRLTRQIGRELEGEQAEDPDHRKLTDDLARRQKRLQDATYDLSVGKNE